MFPFWIILCLWFYTSCVGNCFTSCPVLWSFHCLPLSTRLVDSPVFPSTLGFHADRLHQSVWRSAPCLLVHTGHCYSLKISSLHIIPWVDNPFRHVTWNQSLQTLSLWYNLLLYPGTNVAWPRPGKCKTVSYRTNYHGQKSFFVQEVIYHMTDIVVTSYGVSSVASLSK